MVGSAVAVEKNGPRFGVRAGDAGALLRGEARGPGMPGASRQRAARSACVRPVRGPLWAAEGGAEIVATALLLLEPSEDAHPPLTRRELECLRWTLLGKTAWEVGRILGIAEQTAARHLHHASRKLGCVSKHQAALRAEQLQLIAPRGPAWPATGRRK